MGETLRIILVTAPLLAGAIAIFFAFQLTKRYSVAYVSSYFYYLVFLYIFGAYSLIGSGILEQLITGMDATTAFIHSSRLFMIFLGIPFLVLSKFMLLRFSYDFFQKQIPLAVTVLYFVTGAFVFIGYGLYMVRLTRFGQGDYQELVLLQRWLFLGFMALAYLSIYLVTLSQSRSNQVYDRRFIIQFMTWYLTYMILCCGSFAMRSLHDIVPFVFVFLFLSWHLIPILFLNLYLARYHGSSNSVQRDFELKLDAFSVRFEISKREKEVVRLICKGLSNQEISDSLYISLQTVKDHIHRVFIKTGAKNRVQLSNMIRNT